MEINDKLIEQYNALKPYLFPMLDKLEVYGVYPATPYTEGLGLELFLRSEDVDESRRLHLSFTSVADLHLLVPGGVSGQVYLTSVEIVSMRDQGWQDIKYRVRNSEDEVFSFYCKSFQFALEDM